ncbi:MAG: response regulator [Candidatus Zhuqueibacterota bacterium]
MNDIRLLLADKNLSYLEIARKMLRFHNEAYQVDVATTGDECFQKLFENEYDLLLLDYDIDEKKGLEILPRIIKSGLDVPVVMVIEEGQEDIAFKAIELGAYDYIMKVRGYLTALPFTVGKVLEKRKFKTTKPPQEIQEQAPQVTPEEEPPLTFSPADETLSNEAFYILDRKGRFLSANQKLQEQLNFSEEELLELTLSDLLPADQDRSFYQWLARVDMGASDESFVTQILGKHGARMPVELSISPMRNRNSEVISYKGRIKFSPKKEEKIAPSNGYFDQSRMIHELVKLIHQSYDDSFNHLLERISQLVCQIFQFKRSTLALLDRRKKIFVKQILIGYSNGVPAEKKRIMEVPQDVIEKVFSSQYKVRVIYHDQNFNGSAPSRMNERRSQPRREDKNWHPQDLIIFNLTDSNDQTFGYISVDNPIEAVAPSRDIFKNMEIFTSMVSLAIENFYRFASVEKRNRRLKQLLVTSNIFKLHLSIAEMMKEIVWAVKFSMNYNLVLLGLISRKTRRLEFKSVACDDRIKTIQLKEESIPIEVLRTIFKKEYQRGKSYLVTRSEPALRKLKDLYYDTKVEASGDRYWPWWSMLIVPIYERQGKIIGFIIVDDPADCLLPGKEDIHTLEILANQVSVAIENRLTYLQLQDRAFDRRPTSQRDDDKNEGSIKKIVDMFFR